MTEKELDAEVRRILAKYDLYGYHVRDSRYATTAGFPDWVIIGTSVLYRELKDASGTLSDEQRRVRRLLLDAHQDFGVWRPSDLESGRIELELSAVAHDQQSNCHLAARLLRGTMS